VKNISLEVIGIGLCRMDNIKKKKYLKILLINSSYGFDLGDGQKNSDCYIMSNQGCFY
jgi:hypothetical protein